MIEKRYCDISELRTFFQSADYDRIFNTTFTIKKLQAFGTAAGKVKTEKIEPLFGAVSQMQYLFRSNGQPFVEWWTLQHIILSYLRYALKTGKLVSDSNVTEILNDIKTVKTDQGNIAFQDRDIIQILQALFKYRKDFLISLVYGISNWNFSSAENNAAMSQNKIITPSGQILPPVIEDNKNKKGMNPLYIGAGVLALLFIMKK